MPRKTEVTTTFQKARRTPSKRTHKRTPDVIRKPTGLSPLAQYVEDNLDTGLPINELIEQFQEYDCDHAKREVIASTISTLDIRCEACGLIETKLRPGVKKDEAA